MLPSPPPRRRRTAEDSDGDWCQDDTYDYEDYEYEYDEEFVDEPPFPIDEGSDVPLVELADDEEMQIAVDPEELPGDQTTDPYATPPDVQARLDRLEHVHIRDLPKRSLTIAVKDRSRWSPIWTSGQITYPMFVALRTSSDRETRVYRCRHPGCPARVAFSVRNGEVFLDAAGTNHQHSHPVTATSTRKASSLTDEQRSRIVELWELGVSITNIRRHVGAELVRADAIYDTIRNLKKAERTDQVQKLEDAFGKEPKWRGWECFINREPDGTVTDIYFFHTALLLITHVPFLETWVVDDTSGSNLLALPLVPIIGIDERNCDQLLAFAFLCDRSADSFAKFLDWVVPQLPEPAKPDDPVPRAFMVDRHKGQFAGIRRACPASQILFCARHLESNILDAFRGDSGKELKDKLWTAVRGYLSLHDWQEYLETLLRKPNLTPGQVSLLQSLLADSDRYVGECTHPITSEDVSSRAEGLFGNFKTGEEHKPGTILHVAGSVITYGNRWRVWLARAQESGARPWFPDAVLALSDQRQIGVAIRKLLKEQLEFLEKPEFTPCGDMEAVRSHSCCPFARRWKIPCAHMLNARQWHSPYLTLADFSPRWILPPPPVALPVPGALNIGIRDLSQERNEAHWTYEYALALVEPALSEVGNNPAARSMVIDFADAWHRVERLPSRGDTGDRIRDRVHPGAPGAPFTHPSHHSAQRHMQGGHYIQVTRRRVSGRRQVRCGNCAKLGHNRRTCPDLRGAEPSEENPVSGTGFGRADPD
jgi:hypothetical protein